MKHKTKQKDWKDTHLMRKRASLSLHRNKDMTMLIDPIVKEKKSTQYLCLWSSIDWIISESRVYLFGTEGKLFF